MESQESPERGHPSTAYTGAGVEPQDLAGILRERFKITADQAFGLLIKASAEAGTKVRDIAEIFAATGEAPRRPVGAGRR